MVTPSASAQVGAFFFASVHFPVDGPSGHMLGRGRKRRDEMTHLKAKELYKAGRKIEAWEVAQQDEGWTGEATFEQWCDWMDSLN